MSEDQTTVKVDLQSFSQAYLISSKNVDKTTIQSQKAVQSPSFIHSLSDDLLFEIFSIFVTSSKSVKANPPPQFILSMVCRRWRDIVMYSPLLWTDIFFPTNSTYDIFIFFERSYPAPINVRFDSVSCQLHDDTTLPRFFQALKKHISRLRSLTIIVRWMSDMREFWSPLQSLEALHLLTLSVRLYQSTCDTIGNTVTTHTPLWQGGDFVRSARIMGLCFRCLPLLVGLTKLEIGHAKLDSQDLQALLDNYPSLSTLVIGRFGAPNWAPFPGQTPHPFQVLAPSLRSLAIRIDDSHSFFECACALPWLVMDKLEYLEVMFPGYIFDAHHASILSRLKNVPLLRKIRICGAVEPCLTSSKTFFSSLPKSTDLEFVYYPGAQSNRPALSEVLALPYFRSITFDLTSPYSSHLGYLLSLDDFCMALSCTELKSPITVHLSITENTQKLDKFKAVLGDKLSIHTFPSEEGLLDDWLAPHYNFIDDFPFDDEDDEDLEEDLEDEFEDEIFDEFGLLDDFEY